MNLYVNTIITSALPISENKTRLFVKTYRNNLITGIPVIDYFDEITKYLMEKTLCEDKAVVDSVYPDYKDGNFITKYDELIEHIVMIIMFMLFVNNLYTYCKE